MVSPSPTERRAHERYVATSSVQLDHTPSHRQFPARCRDISRGGMLLAVPALTPVRKGQTIHVCIDTLPQPDLADLASRRLQATVTRVDRNELLSTGQLALGVQFAEPASS